MSPHLEPDLWWRRDVGYCVSSKLHTNWLEKGLFERDSRLLLLCLAGSLLIDNPSNPRVFFSHNPSKSSIIDECKLGQCSSFLKVSHSKVLLFCDRWIVTLWLDFYVAFTTCVSHDEWQLEFGKTCFETSAGSSTYFYFGWKIDDKYSEQRWSSKAFTRLFCSFLASFTPF